MLLDFAQTARRLIRYFLFNALRFFNKTSRNFEVFTNFMKVREAYETNSFEPACCLSAGKKRKTGIVPSLYYFSSLLDGVSSRGQSVFAYF
jgi:hypothetical protein